MSWMTKTFLRGFVAVLPVGLTIYVVYWLVVSIETLLKSVYTMIFGEKSYQPGLGMAFAIVLLFTVGILLNALLVQRVYQMAVGQLEKIPLIKSLYGMLRDMTGFFRVSERKDFNQVVAVRFGDARLIGFVTREEFGDLPESVGGAETVGVYLPMSYQLGGYLAMLPRSAVEPVAMSPEQALRFTITAGVTTKAEGEGRGAALPEGGGSAGARRG